MADLDCTHETSETRSQGLGKVFFNRRQMGKSCIKLGLARAGTGRREVFPFLSDGQSNPEGCQMVAGGSFRGCRGNDHRLTGDNTVASWRDASTVRLQVKPAISKRDPGQASQGSGTHSGCVDQERVYPVVGPFALTDHRLPSGNPPG
jgi:hypothetical protein